MLSIARPLGLIRHTLHRPRNRRPMNSEADAIAARGLPTDGKDHPGISLKEWQGWGTSSPVPSLVTQVVGDLKALEREMETQMSFGGIGGKFQVGISPRFLSRGLALTAGG
ncbi:hypothetical protein ACLOJK_009831 [Asimina triloba]